MDKRFIDQLVDQSHLPLGDNFFEKTCFFEKIKIFYTCIKIFDRKMKKKNFFFAFFWLFFVFLAKMPKNGEKWPKKGKKPRFFGVFFGFSVWTCGKGGISLLAIFCVNLINALFSPQNPIFTTLGSKPISTKFSGFLALFGTPKLTIFRRFFDIFEYFCKKKVIKS